MQIGDKVMVPRTGYQLVAVEDIIELLAICPFDQLKALATENSKKEE